MRISDWSSDVCSSDLQQMAAMRDLMPEACSLAIREIAPDAAAESDAAAFFAELHKAGVMLQYILYSDDDVPRFRDLKARGVVPGDKHFVLFVLGRYPADRKSVVNGKSESVRVALGVRRIIKKKT